MNVAGIFKILIIVVACIIVGGILLNVLLPNTVNGMINWGEKGIKAATGADFDLNGDGDIGADADNKVDDTMGLENDNVDGYQSGEFVNN